MINRRQYIFLSFFLTRSLFFGGAVSVLTSISKNNLLITSMLGMLLGYFLLYLFYRKNGINKISIVMVCFISILISILCNTVLTSNFLLYETPSIVVMITFIIPLIYGSYKEFKVTSRVSELCFPVSIIVILFSLFALPHLAHLDNLFPLFNTNFVDFVKGIIIFASVSLFPNILLINYKENLKFKDVGKGYIMGCFSIIIIMFFILSIYGYEFASIVRFPEYLILKKINIFNYVTNVENIFVLEWIVNLLVSSLLYARVFMDSTSKKSFIIFFILIILSLIFIFKNNYLIIHYIKNYYYYFIFIVLIISLILKKEKANT